MQLVPEHFQIRCNSFAEKQPPVGKIRDSVKLGVNNLEGDLLDSNSQYWIIIQYIQVKLFSRHVVKQAGFQMKIQKQNYQKPQKSEIWKKFFSFQRVKKNEHFY